MKNKKEFQLTICDDEFRSCSLKIEHWNEKGYHRKEFQNIRAEEFFEHIKHMNIPSIDLPFSYPEVEEL